MFKLLVLLFVIKLYTRNDISKQNYFDKVANKYIVDFKEKS